MQVIQTKPFDALELRKKVAEAFPQYIIKNVLGGGKNSFQVRTKNFTLSGNVAVMMKPQKGSLRTQTNLDMAAVYLIFAIPVSIYLWVKAAKIKALEQEVVNKIKEILQQQDDA